MGPNMSLLSFMRLCSLVQDGVITNVDHSQINATSIDIRLGNRILVENVEGDRNHKRVSLKKRTPLDMIAVDLKEGETFELYPGEFILAHSIEKFFLPLNMSAEYKLKSSMARIGCEHMNAGWCDAGWHNSVLTLELKNMTRDHIIVLTPGDFIGQVVFFEHEPVPAECGYGKRGRYNNDNSVSGVKK